jgi:hypothetical protein
VTEEKKVLESIKNKPGTMEEILNRFTSITSVRMTMVLNSLLLANKLMYFKGVYSAAPKANKYKNVWTEVDGKKFQSKKEAARYSELIMLEKAGEIFDLKCQVPYVVSDAVEWTGTGKKLPAIKYVLDFEYKVKAIGGEMRTVCEDVKGKALQLYVLKRSLFLNRYPEIQFKEV